VVPELKLVDVAVGRRAGVHDRIEADVHVARARAGDGQRLAAEPRRHRRGRCRGHGRAGRCRCCGSGSRRAGGCRRGGTRGGRATGGFLLALEVVDALLHRSHLLLHLQHLMAQLVDDVSAGIGNGGYGAAKYDGGKNDGARAAALRPTTATRMADPSAMDVSHEILLVRDTPRHAALRGSRARARTIGIDATSDELEGCERRRGAAAMRPLEPVGRCGEDDLGDLPQRKHDRRDRDRSGQRSRRMSGRNADGATGGTLRRCRLVTVSTEEPRNQHQRGDGECRNAFAPASPGNAFHGGSHTSVTSTESRLAAEQDRWTCDGGRDANSGSKQHFCRIPMSGDDPPGMDRARLPARSGCEHSSPPRRAKIECDSGMRRRHSRRRNFFDAAHFPLRNTTSRRTSRGWRIASSPFVGLAAFSCRIARSAHETSFRRRHAAMSGRGFAMRRKVRFSKHLQAGPMEIGRRGAI